MIQEGRVLCGGPLPPSSLNQGPNQDSHPEQGWGTKDLGPQGPGTPRAILLGGVGAPFNKTSKHPRAVGGVWVLESTPPVRPHGLYCPRGHGVSVGAAPRGPAGSSCVILEPSPARQALASPRPSSEPVSISIPGLWQDTRGTVAAKGIPAMVTDNVYPMVSA